MSEYHMTGWEGQFLGFGKREVAWFIEEKQEEKDPGIEELKSRGVGKYRI